MNMISSTCSELRKQAHIYEKAGDAETRWIMLQAADMIEQLSEKSKPTANVLQEIRNEVANWNKTEPARYVPNYDAFARVINLIDEKIGGES